MEEGDTDWKRAHLRVERNEWRETPTGRERTREWKGMGDRDADWKRAHLRMKVVWGREMPTWRERT